MAGRILVVTLAFIGISVTSVMAQQAPVPAFAGLATHFEHNAGQAPSDARFVARGSGFSLLLTRSGAIVKDGAGGAIRLEFTDGETSEPIGEAALPTVVNYIVGNDPSGWRTNIATFEQVRYADVYPGIDVVYHASRGQMEYDVVLDPGADPKRVRMRFAGADRVAVEKTGDLSVYVNGRILSVRKPVLYQDDGDNRRTVDGAFVRLADGDIGFDVGQYDSRAPLVIDPVLVYSSYLPRYAATDDVPAAIVVSNDGAVLIAGKGTNFFAGSPHEDAFVLKVNPSGSSVAFVTYFGGTDDDSPAAMALGPSGTIYVAGRTWSHDFPVVSATQAVFGGGFGDGFLVKLAPTGNVFEFATFAGGNSTDGAEGLALDGDGNAYLVGSTFSPNFPLLSSPRGYGGNREAFVIKYDAAGVIAYSIFVGGGSWNEMHAAAMAPDGTLVVVGETTSSSFPVTPGAFDTTASSYDGFVARLRADDGQVLQATFLGGSITEHPRAVSVDASNAVYVTGETSSTDFPTTAGVVQASHPGGASPNGFVTKLNPTLSGLIYSTYLGGSSTDYGTKIAVDGAGQAVVTGVVQSNNFPQFSPLFPYSGGALPPSFVTKLSANGTQFVYSMYWPVSVTGLSPWLRRGQARQPVGAAGARTHTFDPLRARCELGKRQQESLI